MRVTPIKTIAICGAGLAGTLCAAALVSALPDEIDLILVDVPCSDEADIFYGTVTSPTIYEFLLNMGITEPDLLPQTNTTFSLGTRYINWGTNKRSWIQSFHHPLPVFQGVAFHHYLTRLRNIDAEAYELEPYIMSARAAHKGVFAHPPEDKKTPLSNMEYGYHFSPREWRDFLLRKIENSPITKISGDIKSLQNEGGHMQSVTLSNDKIIEADLFIDCTGLDSKISQSRIQSERRLKAISSYKSEGNPGNICRLLKGTEYGWHSETSLQDGQHHLTIYHPISEEDALTAHGETEMPPVEVTIGYVDQPWQGNCLTVGHGAAILEPLTPAPMMLLQRDIERLIELIPNTDTMSVEAREYNRRFNEDYNHASLFQRGFIEDETPKKNPYWQSAIAIPTNSKLASKITQFQSRGTVVQYDLEPFRKEDWTQQHFGLGRLPRRYDPLADRANEEQIIQTLKQMRVANESMAAKMPPHQIYMKKLLEYFRKKHG